MSKLTDRKCTHCGCIEKTTSTSQLCQKCNSELEVEENKKRELRKITEWGYSIVAERGKNVAGSRMYLLKAKDCKEFELSFANLRKRMERRHLGDVREYPKSIFPNPSQTVGALLINSRNRISKTDTISLPSNLKHEILELVKQLGMKGDDFYEALYWVINDLQSYPKKCECGEKITLFSSFYDGYRHDFCSLRCSNNSETVKHKKEKASLDIFGVSHHFSSSETKTKIKNTFIKNYGVEHNMQDETVFLKNMKSQYRLKQFKLPSGKIINIMGYEPQAIGWLLKNGYSEDDLMFSSIKTVKYEFEGKNHFYRADLFMPSTNTLIEVKSTWTLKADLEKNNAKITGSVEAGFNHWLLVLDKSGNLIEERMSYAKV